MALPDVPASVRGDLSVGLNNHVYWPSRDISNAIQRTWGAMEADGVAQILNGALGQRGNRFAAVSLLGEMWPGRVATL